MLLLLLLLLWLLILLLLLLLLLHHWLSRVGLSARLQRWVECLNRLLWLYLLLLLLLLMLHRWCHLWRIVEVLLLLLLLRVECGRMLGGWLRRWHHWLIELADFGHLFDLRCSLLANFLL